MNKRKSKPQLIGKKEHNIQQSQLSDNVLTILKKLKKAGFHGYIVGGGVRDLLLGYQPKDFDIATDAKPEQIKNLFNNSRIIGRRFRLVHVYFKRDIIEVATFRAPPPSQNTDDHITLDGQIIRDNTYGCIEDDIWRRDFTLNALYYDPLEDVILDYCDGYLDLKNHMIKIIGKPNIRYTEDPVRMLRAIRFAAKLDFTIEDKSLAPLKDTNYHDLLDNIPSARLFEEYNKFFLTGHAEKSFISLRKYHLFNKLFPFTANNKIIEEYHDHLGFLHSVLQSTDKRISNQLPVNPAFLLAAFLWHPLQDKHKSLKDNSSSREYIWRLTVHELLKQQNTYLSIPKRFTKVIEEIWYLQRLFVKKSKKSVLKAAHHPKFRAGFDFLILRSKTEKISQAVLDFWCHFEQSEDNKRKKILEEYE